MFGSLENFRRRNIHANQNKLIQEELGLIARNSPLVRALKVAPGARLNQHPRIRRTYNKYGSKPPLTPGYIAQNNGSLKENPRLKKVRGRYETQRQCEYVPKLALMKMAKDFGIEPYKSAKPGEFRKGSNLWKAGRTVDICKAMSAKYRSQKQKPIRMMTAYRDQSLKGVKQSLEFMAARVGVRTVRNDGTEKSLLVLSREIKDKIANNAVSDIF